MNGYELFINKGTIHYETFSISVVSWTLALSTLWTCHEVFNFDELALY